jgi:hypothetical protein
VEDFSNKSEAYEIQGHVVWWYTLGWYQRGVYIIIAGGVILEVVNIKHIMGINGTAR